MTGPYETEQQVRELSAVRAVYDAFERDPGAGKMTPHCRRILDDACSAAGLETGAYDHRILVWLAGWGPDTCAVVAGLITRAYEAGVAARSRTRAADEHCHRTDLHRDQAARPARFPAALRRNGSDAVTGDGMEDPFCPRCREMGQYCVCDQAANTDTPKPDGRTVASRLVDIANDIFTFGCAMTSRRHPGDPEPVVYVFAVPKVSPGSRRPLPDIRPDLAALYQAMYGAVPGASALGDAMMVLEGQARQAQPAEADESLLALLVGGKSAATRIIQLARERYRFGVMATGDVFGVPVSGPNIARLLRAGRRSLRSELAGLYYAEHKTAAPAQALADALLVIEGQAQAGDAVDVALRTGQDDVGQLVLDLGRDDGQVAIIGAGGWQVSAASPVLFRRTKATLALPLPLPLPAGSGSLAPLRELLNIAAGDWPLIVAWLIAALVPPIPHPVLLLRGEQGTAKSTAARILTSLLDPCASQLRTAPRSLEDWAVAASGSWVTCLDNISDIPPWLSDAICRAVTGDGLLRRERYTDSDVSVLTFQRVIAMTSIDPGRLQGDLADRLLAIELARIDEDSRAADQSIADAWRGRHAGVLAGLLDFAADVLAVLPAIRTSGKLPRMADYGRILLAVDQILGTDGYQRYADQAGQIAEQVADADSVALAIRERVTVRWEGTASELLVKLAADHLPKDWPATPQGMGGRLSRAAPALRALRWVVEPPDRARAPRYRCWTLQPPGGQENQPADMERTEQMELPPPDLGEDIGDPA